MGRKQSSQGVGLCGRRTLIALTLALIACVIFVVRNAPLGLMQARTAAGLRSRLPDGRSQLKPASILTMHPRNGFERAGSLLATPTLRHHRRGSEPISHRTPCWTADELAREFRTLTIDPAYLEHLDPLPPIPKVIHVLWSGPDLLGRELREVPMVKYGIAQLKSMNPDWEFKVYSEADMDAFMKSKLPPHDWEMYEGAPLVAKGDLWRILKMYYEGGLYMDVDRMYNIPLSKLIKSTTTKLMLPTAGDMTFTTDFFCTSPGNVLFKRAYEIFLCTLRREYLAGQLHWPTLNAEQLHTVVVEPMGTFWASATEVLFGRPLWGPRDHSIEADGAEEGKAFMDHIRGELGRSGDRIITHREMWCDLIVSRPPWNFDTSVHEDCKWVQKAVLFNAAKMVQWDSDVATELIVR